MDIWGAGKLQNKNHMATATFETDRISAPVGERIKIYSEYVALCGPYEGSDYVYASWGSRLSRLRAISGACLVTDLITLDCGEIEMIFGELMEAPDLGLVKELAEDD